MDVSVGTFNLNNLFSRFNLYTEAEAPTRGGLPAEPPREWLHRDISRDGQDGDDDVVVLSRGEIGPDGRMRWRRTFRGRLIFAKDPDAQKTLARRIGELDADVLAVQEVENIEALEDFVRFLGLRDAGYRHLALVEGNDDRFIDVGVVARLPLGGVTSWRHRTHPEDPRNPVFSRDLLQVEVLSPERDRVLLTVYVNHLKSQLGGQEGSDRRRRRQAEAIAQVTADHPPAGPYVVLGDMNDTPDAAPLRALVEAGLVNGLAEARETGGPYPADDTTPPPAGVPWTHRFRGEGETRYDLYDQIWLDPGLASRLDDAWILRRTTRGGDASDHDPAAVRLTGLG